MSNRPKLPQKALDRAKAEFERKGVSITDWADEHQVHRSLVYEVLSGRRTCRRGQSHKIAVLLGLKAGEIVR